MRVGGQIVFRVEYPPDQLGGHLLARAVIDREQVEKFLLVGPVLHDLRRQFDEIAVDGRSGQARIGSGGENAVQRMAELVQHRRHLVEREQRRQAVGRLRKVVDHRNQRPRLDAVLDSLLAELGHPCSAAFRGAGEEVHIQNG